MHMKKSKHNYAVMFKLHDYAIVIKCENSSNWVRKSFNKLYILTPENMIKHTERHAHYSC